MNTISQTVDVNSLMYKNEKPLFVLHFLLSLVFWLLLLAGTFGLALVYLLFFYIGYLFAQSGLIAYLKGNGVKITAQQFPDLYERYEQCCRRLGASPAPEAYLINGGGHLNAFATRFLGRDFVVLYSNIVDAMADKPEALNFYIGHELGHIRRKHLKWSAFLWPASILPLLGSAYSRAREYTCDQYGRACCDNPEAAMQGLAALATGEKRWATLNFNSYFQQTNNTGEFWMSFHELLADYPWLVKRAARLSDPAYAARSRNPLAWLLALFVPRLGIGGGAGGLVVMIAMIGILAAIAIPAYQDYTTRARLTEAVMVGELATRHVSEFYARNQAVPDSLATAGFTAPASRLIKEIAIDAEDGTITMTLALTPRGENTLVFVPSVGETNQLRWVCASDDIPDKQLPAQCRSQE